MRKLFAAFVLVMLSSSCFAATIKFFTDYPNAVPVGSDFFVFQRNQSYINATVSQVKSDWFNNPSFTGNGAISGAFGVGGFFVANGIMYGNGAGLTNVLTLTTNVSFQFITNNIEYTTNLFVTTNFVNTSFTTNLFVDNSITTNLFVTQEFVTNLVAGTITNNTFVTTNVFVDNSVTINSNLTVQTITNVNLFTTNITATTITNNTFITTNITINQPGGFTNLNAVPNTVAYWDINGSLGGVPNAPGVMTNNGSGGVGFSTSLSLTEIDAQNFYPTNLFTGLTNVSLATDGNGKLIAGGGGPQAWTNNSDFIWPVGEPGPDSTGTLPGPAFFFRKDGSHLIGTNVNQDINWGAGRLYALHSTTLVNSNEPAIQDFTISALSDENFDFFSTIQGSIQADKDTPLGVFSLNTGSTNGNSLLLKLQTAYGQPAISFKTNSTFVFSVSASGKTSVTGFTNTGNSASQFVVTDANKAETTTLDGSTLTNLTYRYITNNTGNTTLNWSTAYRTNIAADVTLALQSVTAAPNAQFYETIVYWVTNSSASNFKTTWPSGVIGPVGSGTPAVLYCTNKTLTRILVEHYGPNDITVSKTDFGN